MEPHSKIFKWIRQSGDRAIDLKVATERPIGGTTIQTTSVPEGWAKDTSVYLVTYSLDINNDVVRGSHSLFIANVDDDLPGFRDVKGIYYANQVDQGTPINTVVTSNLVQEYFFELAKLLSTIFNNDGLLR